MACPDLHINSLSVNVDGWIILAENNNDNVHITPSCQRLLNLLQLDLTSDIIIQEIQETTEEDALRRLPHSTELSKCIIRVIADIRRMGTPKEGGVGNRRNQGKGLSKKKRSQRNNAARLEEQRRLRNEKEFQQQQSSELSVEEEHTEDNGVLDDEDSDEIPLELQTAAVFNSLRVLIAILRPMLYHPEKMNYDLKMVNGPSIQKKGCKLSFYLFSNKVYSCISEGTKREINREYQALVQLTGKKGIVGMTSKEYTLSLFNHEVYSMTHTQVAEKCFDVTDDINSEASEKIHNALMYRFENEHDEKQYKLQRSIDNLQEHLHRALSRRFRGVVLTVYGSCLSGLALEGSHDVDVSIFIPELNTLKQQFDNGCCSGDQYQKLSKKIIFRVRDSLKHSKVEFFDLIAITRARVPVVKGSAYMQNPYTEDGHIQFDLCFLNDIAVINSSLLREYSLFDSRVRILMLSVKSFAKTNGLASAADGTLSSYTWNNLVIFYLQCIGMLPALQCPTLIEEHDWEVDMSDRWNSINGLDTFYLSKDMIEKKGIWQPSPGVNDSNLTMLIYGFFNFYTAIFPSTVTAASIRLGKITLQKTCLDTKLGKLSVEDPFEICSSHCPHDLGSHAKEDGQAKISKQIMQATKELGELIQMPLDNEHASSVLGKLFGQPPQHHPQKHTNAAVRNRNNVQAPQRQHNNQNRNSRQHNNNRSNNGGGRHNNHGKQQQHNKNNKPGRGHTNPPRSQTGYHQSNNPAKMINMNTNGTQPQNQTNVKPAITEEFKQQQRKKLMKQKDDKQGGTKKAYTRSKKQRHKVKSKSGNGAGEKEDGGGTKHNQSDKRYRQKVNAANSKKKATEENSNEK